MKFDDAWKKPDPVAPALGTANGHSRVVVDPAVASKYAAAALADEADQLAHAADGTRNDALNRAWFKMGRHVGAGSIDAETVRAALAAAARECGLPESEIATTLRTAGGGLEAGAAVPRHPDPRPEVPTVTVLQVVEDVVPDGDPLGNSESPEEQPAETDAEQRSRLIRAAFPLVNWAELWAAEDDEEEWIVEPILPARRLIALFSAPKVGKSLLMLEIAAAVARGTPVLGARPSRPYRVLYIDFENDMKADVRPRLKAMNYGPYHLDNLQYLTYPKLAHLDSPTGAMELMAAVGEYQSEVVVIDTISRAVGGEENENDTWLRFYRNTGLALKQAGVACIRLDHTGKDHEKGMRGGSAKYGDVDAVWKLSKVTDETYQLECTDHRMPVTEDVLVVERHRSPLRHVVKAEGRVAAFRAKIAEVVAALDAADLANDTGRPGAKAQLTHVGLTASSAVIEAAVAERKLRIPPFQD